ncbi:MAG: hypothetical protein ABL882_06810 [Sphingopyxis sp.]
MSDQLGKLKGIVSGKLGEDVKAKEDLHYPRHLLILSADIVGSTALKQNAGFSPHALETILSDKTLNENQKKDAVKKIEKWFEVLRYFYTESTNIFNKEFRDLINNVDAHDVGDTPTLWKTVGDEVLFYKNVTKPAQISNTVIAWRRAMQHLRAGLKAHEQRLDIKCTAWLAEFPVENKILIAPSGSMSGASACSIAQTFDEKMRLCNGDFVGPSIDIGFRLAALSTSRKFMISLDVAYFLATVSGDDISIHYDGRQYFKGVAGGVEYPTFWIDMGEKDTLDRKEDGLLNRSLCADRDVKEFCQKFYDDKDNPSFAPFLFSERVPAKINLSQSYVEAYNIIVEQHDGTSC